MASALQPAPAGALDMMLLCSNQTHAHRIAALWSALGLAATRVFPAGLCQQAIEVGPHGNRFGPQLVLFQATQLTAQQLLAWLKSSYIRRYCHRMFVLDDTPAAASKQELIARLVATGPPADGGAVRVMANKKTTELALVAALLDAGWEVHPVHFQHVLSVVELERSYRWHFTPAACHWRYPSSEPAAHADSVATAVYKLEEALAVSGIGKQQGVQLTPQPQLVHIQQPQQQGAVEDPEQQRQQQPQQEQIQQQQSQHQPQQQPQQQPQLQHLSQPRLPQQQQEQKQQEQQPDNKQQVQQTSPTQQQKQQQQNSPEQQQQQQQQQQGLEWALDLGASPGAWTSYLAARCTNVIAVDPAFMSPAALLPNVTHVKLSAADAVPHVEALLGGAVLDLLVCDMNQSPMKTAEMIKPLLHLLRPGGHLIMTLKFKGFGRDKALCRERLDEAYQEELHPGQCLWLLANTQCERTYMARRR